MRKKISILLVEDNEINQFLSKTLLIKNGYMVTIAENGRTALKMWKKENFDLILMDIMLPDIDGCEITETIRKKEEQTGNHIPIIAITARDAEIDKVKCIKCGMDDFMPKPIHNNKLRSMISRVMKINRPKSSINYNQSIDLSNLMISVNGDMDLFKACKEQMKENFPIMINKVRESINNKDSVQLERDAHYMKGLIVYLRNKILNKMVNQLENINENLNFDQAHILLKKIEKILLGFLQIWDKEK